MAADDPKADIRHTMQQGERRLARWEAREALRERLEPLSPEDAVRRLLFAVGEDPTREGLHATPGRVVRALLELTQGYHLKPAEVLATTFATDDIEDPEATPAQYNGIILLKDIPFNSTCEHHLLPFLGEAHVAYIPGENGRVVGLSKLARLVDIFALRLQMQERLTAQIAQAIKEHLGAAGVLVVISAAHACMRLRGVRKPNTQMVTSEVRGLFQDNAAARAEAMSLLKGA